jgi:hypothetical protein
LEGGHTASVDAGIPVFEDQLLARARLKGKIIIVLLEEEIDIFNAVTSRQYVVFAGTRRDDVLAIAPVKGNAVGNDQIVTTGTNE